MTKKAVGRVKATNQDSTTNGEKFGIKLSTDDGEAWYNGWGSLPEGVKKGAKIQLTYELNESGGNMYRNIEDKDAIDILEEGETSSDSSSNSKNFSRQNAIKAVSSIFQGIGTPNARQLQAMKILIEEFENYNETGEFDSMEDLILQSLQGEDSFGVEGITKQEDKPNGKERAVEEDSEESSEEVSNSESSESAEGEASDSSKDEEVTEEEKLQEEMEKAAEVQDKGDSVIFGDDDEEGEALE